MPGRFAGTDAGWPARDHESEGQMPFRSKPFGLDGLGLLATSRILAANQQWTRRRLVTDKVLKNDGSKKARRSRDGKICRKFSVRLDCSVKERKADLVWFVEDC